IFMGGYATTPATAADLGGDCCADLEERVAELEATTVRKKARQLSMTISGRVHSAIMHWDDGGGDTSEYSDSDTVVAPGLAASRIVVDGRAKLREGWEAGYRIGWEFVEEGRGIRAGHSSATSGQQRPTSSSIEAYEAYWFIRGARVGAISVGTRGQSYGGASKVDISGRTGLVANADPRLYGGSIRFRTSSGTSTGLTLNPAFQVDDGDDGAGERSGVRYDSPTMGGFILTADWVNKDFEEDVYGLRLSFARQMGDFKVAAAAGWYQEEYVGHSDDSTSEHSGILGSIGIMHNPSGVFVNFGAGDVDYDAGDNDDASFWYITAGLKRKWSDRGPTTIYAQYYDSSDNSAAAADQADFDSSYWGFGIAQDFSAANMYLYAGYRSYETDAQVGGESLKDIDTFIFGGIVNF
ncbi:MAG: hypothetical protein ACR2OW_12650, partial [Methyloligellaceae bacterium]